MNTVLEMYMYLYGLAIFSSFRLTERIKLKENPPTTKSVYAPKANNYIIDTVRMISKNSLKGKNGQLMGNQNLFLAFPTCWVTTYEENRIDPALEIIGECLTFTKYKNL